jgi:hypothetical protein
MLYQHKTMSIALSVQKGILHVPQLFITQTRSYTALFSRTRVFFGTFRKINCSIVACYRKSMAGHITFPSSTTVNRTVRSQERFLFFFAALFHENLRRLYYKLMNGCPIEIRNIHSLKRARLCKSQTHVRPRCSS